jgi:alpha-1,6-mannosyltransferase
MHLVDITMFYAAEGGGVSTYINAKARWLAQRTRIRHTICSPGVHAGGCAPVLAQVPGIELPGFNGYRMPRSVGAAERILRGLAPDLIEIGDAGHCAWAALRNKRRSGIPVVAFYHSDLPRLVETRMGTFASGVVKKYLNNLYRQCDMVLAPSRRMVQQLDAFGIAGAIHQPLGIDVSTFCPQRRVAGLRAHLRLPPETRLLVYAGRFTPEKKLMLLIDAVRRLGRPYHLLLIGGGAVLPRYPQISFMPFKRDQRALARLLASCDVLVHPGDCETFGLIVLEAMACGLPVVASNGGGVAELVDPDTGILVAPDSVAQLCEGIEAIYQLDRLRMGQNASRNAAAYYDWNLIVPQVLGRYASLLATSERAELEAEYAYVNK